MKISSLSIRNFAGISWLDFVPPPDARLILVRGANRSGKSTVLAAIKSAIHGKRHDPVDPVRRPTENSTSGPADGTQVAGVASEKAGGEPAGQTQEAKIYVALADRPDPIAGWHDKLWLSLHHTSKTRQFSCRLANQENLRVTSPQGYLKKLCEHVAIPDVLPGPQGHAGTILAEAAKIMQRNPAQQIRVLCIEDGDKLDDESFRTLHRLAEEHDFQVWLCVTRLLFKEVDKDGCFCLDLDEGRQGGSPETPPAETGVEEMYEGTTSGAQA